MKIEHLAIWVHVMEIIKDFYIKYFRMTCNEKYVNEKKGFSSYFLAFEEGARLEIMHRPDIVECDGNKVATFGITHLAISVGSKAMVNELTEKLRKDGYIVEGEPRTTGDGYYESVILDPEGNSIEITE